MEVIKSCYSGFPTKIIVDKTDTIGEIASYVHMTEQELCGIIQNIIDDDLNNTANNAKPSRTFFD